MAWEPPRPPARTAGRGPAAVIIVVASLLVAGVVTGGAVFALRGDNGGEKQTAGTTTSTGLPGTTATTNPLGNLGDLGNAGGALGDLFGGDVTQLAQCFAGNIGDLLQGGSIPKTNAAAQYQAIVQWVQQDRGLRFRHVPTPTYVTQAEMARRVAAQITHDYTPAAAQRDEAMLTALGAIPPGTNLRRTYAQFVGGQVAGYYDPDNGEMVILGNPAQPLDGTELTTVAHELEHALADQNLHLPEATKSTQAQNDDAQLAATALVEGDATLTMTEFQFEKLGLSDLFSGNAGDLGEATQSLQDAPPYLAHQLLFPYGEGLSFVCALRENGGWAAVNRAYARTPTTTAQIMFPDRYRNSEQAQPTPSQSPGPGWRAAHAESFGAADLMFLFDAPGGDSGAALSNARDRAGAWAGGTATLWSQGGRDAVGLSLVSQAQSPSLCDSVTAWKNAAFAHGTPNDEHVTVQCHGNAVQAGFAPDAATANRLAGTG